MVEMLQQLQADLSSHLKDNLLDYWIRNTVDEVNGGFIGHINSDNSRIPKSSKGIVLNTRILWAFSSAYLHLKDEKYLILADRAYQYLLEYFKDPKHGGVFWEVDYQGKPINKRKQIYAQAFAIYALSAYYRVTKKESVLTWAIELFYLIERYSHDKILGGYQEAFNSEWSILDDVRLSEKDANENKTMNTHLHILEAYTSLIGIWQNEKIVEIQKELIQLFLHKFIDKDGHLHLFFEDDWTLKSDTISYGHDIESSWLFVEAAKQVSDNKLLVATEKVAIKIADELLKDGIDIDGSIFNEKDKLTGHLDTDKHWWPQAEGLVGLFNVWQITREEKYINAVFNLWSFIQDKIIDKEHGEWFWKVDKAGNTFPMDEKVGFWKCPYHNVRACLEMINRLKFETEHKDLSP